MNNSSGAGLSEHGESGRTRRGDAPRNAPPFRPRLLAPRWWPTWLALGAVWLLCWLPIPLLLALGEGLGWTFGQVSRRRRHIVRTNLRLCFPRLAAAEREALADAHFKALGAGAVEAALAWFAPDWRLRGRFTIEGREHLERALASGRGLLLLTGHFTTLEIGARGVCTAAGLPFHAMYRPYSNAVLDFFMHRWRERRSGLPALPREDLRAIVKAMRQGRAIWYAPDQTLGGREHVFVPFFGEPVQMLTATSRLAQMGRALVLPYFPAREGSRYRLRFLPPLEDFPSGDDAADARRVNELIEQGVRAALPQYFWVHRRFKKRPPGMAKAY